ncbi:hypothetical protein Tco_1054731 [Tanacetum coccineum]|uniref:Integrase, catalytic region, zinc finger, CCHC-type, peptidase aspartic, catalytic n=1 Tax=Tanacetum coccineum TaxID=301880 RepID=A0ABQ5GYI4_9ASTR
MLDRTDFASWQQRIRLYCRGNENSVNILKSIDEGPFQIGTFREALAEGTEGALGLPKDIYTLINHYTDAKDIWGNVKMLLEGLELTKEDRESKLYDDFEHFRQNKGETIHDYYIQFAKLINDMQNIKMTMSRMQLNSKFVNNMLPEWGRFMTAVKLNRGLRDSNYDQLYAYLKKHEAHANENKMMLDRFTQHTMDPLALMSNVSHRHYYSQSSRTPPSTYVPPHFGGGATGYGDNRTELGMLIQVKHGRLSATTTTNGVALDEEQLLFIAGGQDNDIDEDVDEKPVQDLALNVDNMFQADDCDAFDSDVDEAPMVQTMFMANLSSADLVYDKAGPSYDSDILSEYVKDNAVPVVQSNVSSILNDAYMMIYNDMYEPHAQSISKTTRNTVVDNSLTTELATYKKQVELYERRARFELTESEQKIDEQLRIVITDRNIKEENLKKELHSVKLQLASTINHNKSMVEEVTSLKKDFKQKENKYLKEFLDMKALKEKVEDKLYKQDQSLQTVHMLCKPKLYNDELNKMKAEALKEQTTASRPIKALTVYPPNTPATLVPGELPTKIQVKINIFALIQLFSEFDINCKKRITPTRLTEGERGFEQTKECYLTEVIPFFRTLKEHFEGIQKAPTKEVKEMKDIFEELEAEIDQNVIDRKHDEIKQKKTFLLLMII